MFSIRQRRFGFVPVSLLAARLLIVVPACAQRVSAAWLRYAPLPQSSLGARAKIPPAIVTLDSSPTAASAQAEMLRGVRSMLGCTLRIAPQGPAAQLPDEDAWVLATTDELHTVFPHYDPPALGPEGFAFTKYFSRGHKYWLIDGADSRGILYGAFHLLLGMAGGESFTAVQGADSPAAPIRWTNE